MGSLQLAALAFRTHRAVEHSAHKRAARSGAQGKASAAAVLATDLHDFLGGSYAQVQEEQGRESAALQQARTILIPCPRASCRWAAPPCTSVAVVQPRYVTSGRPDRRLRPRAAPCLNPAPVQAACARRCPRCRRGCPRTARALLPGLARLSTAGGAARANSTARATKRPCARAAVRRWREGQR